jgi:hypothetical protein
MKTKIAKNIFISEKLYRYLHFPFKNQPKKHAMRPSKYLIFVATSAIYSLFACNAATSDSKKAAPTVETVSKVTPPDPEVVAPELMIPVVSPVIKDSAVIIQLSKNIMAMLAKRDFKAISALVHPTLGVQFSPYSFIDTASHGFSPKNLVIAAADGKKSLIWGQYDGSGEPIKLTFSQYVSKFVCDKDFLKAGKMSFNRSFDQGNSVNNIKAAFPNVIFTEFYVAGTDKKYGGMDWAALRLVFQKEGATYYLIGIVHDQWTI